MKLRELFLSDRNGKTLPLKAAFNLLLLTAVIITVFWLSLTVVGVTFDFRFISEYSTRIGQGFVMTLLISLASFVVSLLLGVMSALGQGSRVLMVRYLCNLYVKFIRGTPLMMQIYLFFYIIGTAWGIDNRFLAGVLILSIFEGAYISEIIRGSLLSIDATQWEAAKAVGFSHRQTLRLVVLPQMVARTLPALTGQLASIIKDSSLLSMIAVIELTQTMREISADNYKLFECYFLLGVLYLVLTLPVTLITKKLEKKYSYET
jgi:polar amino acid transport system permease protein